MSKNPIWQLLRRNVAPGQLIGYALANLVGLTIVLTALQFYRDATTPMGDAAEDAVLANDYLVVSKVVHGVSMAPSTFSADEIADLESQPWAKRVGSFTASQFQVLAAVSMNGRGMSTYLFFESIPDDFIDVKPQGWQDFDASMPGSTVPIIISKDYLALYNFGFAATQGLPQLSERLISTVNIDLRLQGGDHMDFYRGRVVGFSSRLNTIAVPQSFMDMANRRYAPGLSPEPSRLVVEVTNPGEPAIGKYLEEKGWETAGDKSAAERSTRFLTVLSTVVASVGLIICVLAIFILMLSIYLLLQKSRRKLRDLMLLGYSHLDVSVYYVRLVATINAIVCVLSIAITLLGRHLWGQMLEDMSLGGGGVMVMILTAVGATAVVTAFNVWAIRRNLLKI
jgi:hypothetical protein